MAPNPRIFEVKAVMLAPSAPRTVFKLTFITRTLHVVHPDRAFAFTEFIIIWNRTSSVAKAAAYDRGVSIIPHIITHRAPYSIM